MQFLSLEPFIPSGADFERARLFFQEIGFNQTWDAGGYAGFERDGCRFILQDFTNKDFAENLMISVRITNAEEFWTMLNEKKVVEKFGVRIAAPRQQAYGKEVNVIDPAGVCWHFVE